MFKQLFNLVISFFMNSENARVYEIVDKVTGEVLPVNHLGSGDADNDADMDFITHKEDGTEVVFTQPGYVNEQYVVRDTETKLSPDGVTPVPDVVVTPAEGSNEGAVVPEAPVVPEVEEEAVATSNTLSAEPQKFYEGKLVISDTTREVNEKTYHAIRTVDGATFDLTVEEYEAKVTVQA